MRLLLPNVMRVAAPHMVLQGVSPAPYRLPMVVPVVSMVLLSRSRVRAALTASAFSFSSARCRVGRDGIGRQARRPSAHNTGTNCALHPACPPAMPPILHLSGPQHYPQPTCSSGNTVHLTGAVMGVKRNTVRCRGEGKARPVGRLAVVLRSPVAAQWRSTGQCSVILQLRVQPPLPVCQPNKPPAHLVVALPRVEGVLKQAVQDAANAERRLNHAGREVPAVARTMAGPSRSGRARC